LKDFLLCPNLRRAARGELPVDFDSGAIHPAIPGACFLAQRVEVRNSSLAEALPREEADFDFGMNERVHE
jgi:hypothetical protein